MTARNARRRASSPEPVGPPSSRRGRTSPRARRWRPAPGPAGRPRCPSRRCPPASSPTSREAMPSIRRLPPLPRLLAEALSQPMSSSPGAHAGAAATSSRRLHGQRHDLEHLLTGPAGSSWRRSGRSRCRCVPSSPRGSRPRHTREPCRRLPHLGRRGGLAWASSSCAASSSAEARSARRVARRRDRRRRRDEGRRACSWASRPAWLARRQPRRPR